MKNYAVADLHGNMDLYNKILDIVGNNRLFIIGDLCDRGPDGYSMVKDALNRPNVIYILGNHEDMFADAAAALSRGNVYDQAVYNCISNGGSNTIKSWIKDGNPLDIIEKIKQLPTSAKYINKSGKEICLIHSGSFADPLWDRNHFYKIDETIPENQIIVHGHTNVFKVRSAISDEPFDKTPQILVYNNGQKVDLDLGTYITKAIVLLDLDTLVSVYLTQH